MSAGRTRARLLFVHRSTPVDVNGDDEIRAVCACGAWRGPWRTTTDEMVADHAAHLAAMLVVGGVATPEEQARARTQQLAGAPNSPTPVPMSARPMPRPSLLRRGLCRLLGGHHTNATGACYSCGRRP